jgi:hypothetical protein
VSGRSAGAQRLTLSSANSMAPTLRLCLALIPFGWGAVACGGSRSSGESDASALGARGAGGFVATGGSGGTADAGGAGSGAGGFVRGTADAGGAGSGAGGFVKGAAGAGGSTRAPGLGGSGGSAGGSKLDAGSADARSADGTGGSTPTQICTSGVYWSGLPGPTMDPGDTCQSCHSTFQIAGTVYPTAHEPTGCIGAAGTGRSVVITGSDGRVQTLTLNSSGNFYSTQKVVFPFHAKVVSPTGERDMTASQSNGDCNYCHSPTGFDGAPGRIMLP